jgi:hypothetical protein
MKSRFHYGAPTDRKQRKGLAETLRRTVRGRGGRSLSGRRRGQSVTPACTNRHCHSYLMGCRDPMGKCTRRKSPVRRLPALFPLLLKISGDIPSSSPRGTRVSSSLSWLRRVSRRPAIVQGGRRPLQHARRSSFHTPRYCRNPSSPCMLIRRPLLQSRD